MKPRGPIMLLLTSRMFRLCAAVVIALPLLYVASFGPACRATQWTDQDAFDRLLTVYSPILHLSRYSPWMQKALTGFGGETGEIAIAIHERGLRVKP
jgi:hypothetical protein